MTTTILNYKRRGFTLVELIVAMGITVILLTLLVSVTAVALDGWRISRNKVRAGRQAKAALSQLSNDFESMVVRAGNDFEWLYADTSSDSLGPNDTKSPNAARLIFFSAATDRYNGDIGGNDDNGGNVSAVGYELFYKDPITDAEGTDHDVFVLYRSLVDPKTGPNEGAFYELLGQEDLESEFTRKYGSRVDDAENFVCENIFEMSVVFTIEYTEAGADSTDVKIKRMTIIDTGSPESAQKFRVTGNSIEVDGNDNGAFNRGRIVAVDVSLTVLTDAGIAAIKRVNFRSNEAREKFLRKNSYQYSKTILLPQP